MRYPRKLYFSTLGDDVDTSFAQIQAQQAAQQADLQQAQKAAQFATAPDYATRVADTMPSGLGIGKIAAIVAVGLAVWWIWKSV